MPAAAIGSLALVLAAGFDALGVLGRLDSMISGILESRGSLGTTKNLPDVVIWIATGLMAFGSSLAILAVPGQWRRVILWISALVLVATWAPVLWLASHAPTVSGAWIATLWSGVCALVYAAKHQMPVDETVEE